MNSFASRIRSLGFTLAATVAIGACTQSTSAIAPDPEPEPEDMPAVVEVAAVALPAFDTELYKATCQTTSGQCPVVRWEGVDYVALSYRDNRFSFALHAFGADGSVRAVRELEGARYIAAVDLDTAARSVRLVGQSDRAVTLSFDDLRALR